MYMYMKLQTTELSDRPDTKLQTYHECLILHVETADYSVL